MNTHEELRAMLDDFAGGELDEAGRRAVLRHLDGCAECRAEVAAVRALLDEARFLPREVAPPRDLWASIAPRLEPRAVFADSIDIPSTTSVDSIASSASAGPIASADDGGKVISLESRRRVWKAPKWLLAAAATIVVAVGSSLITMAAMNARGTTGPVADGGTLPPETVTQSSRPGTALAAFRPAEAEYQAAIDDLTRLLESRRDRILPETAATLEENLRIIDEAIRQSRAALERDPNSAELTQMLSSVYDAKVRTLQQAVSL